MIHALHRSDLLDGVVSDIERVTGKTARRSGGRLRLCCPAHDDEQPSLSVWADDDGNVAVKCFAGCTTDDVCAAIDRTVADLFVRPLEPVRAVPAPVVPRGVTAPGKRPYVYVNADGSPAFRVMRIDTPSGKKVWQETPLGGGWAKTGPTEAMLVPYRLPELIAGVSHDATIYVVEGEKCADALANLGFIATTNPGGAGKWKAAWSHLFIGARVVILPDNDDAGRAHAESVAEALTGAALSVTTVTLPGLPEKGDVADWLAAGNGRLDFLTAVDMHATKPAAAPGKDISRTLSTPISTWGWPECADDMFYGPLGTMTHLLAEQSEADPAAIYSTLLTGVGAMVGRRPAARIGNTLHQLQLFTLIVGDTARARKGTSYSDAARVLRLISGQFMDGNEARNLSSGEGFIHRLRDPRADETDAPADKRLLVYLSEFSTALRNANRESNNLSGVLREAWDGGKLEVMTKADPMTATGYHLGLVGHITIPELQRELSETAQANGFANRFLMIGSKRPRLLSRPKEVPDDELMPYAMKVTSALSVARNRGGRTIEFSEAAWDRWDAIYTEVESRVFPNMVTQLVVRGSAYITRIAALHAVIDASPMVEPHHLDAGLALWKYSQDTVLHIYGDRIGDPVADKLLTALREAGQEGMSGRDIQRVFSNHLTADKLTQAAGLLTHFGLIEVHEVTKDRGGRPSMVYRAI